MAREETDARTASQRISLSTREPSAPPVQAPTPHPGRGTVHAPRDGAPTAPRPPAALPAQASRPAGSQLRCADTPANKDSQRRLARPARPRAVVARHPPVGAPTWSEERLLNHAQERPATAQITSLAASACPSAATTSSVESSCNPQSDAKSLEEEPSGTEPPGRKRRCRAHAKAASSAGRGGGMPGPQCAGR